MYIEILQMEIGTQALGYHTRMVLIAHALFAAQMEIAVCGHTPVA